MLYCHFDKKFLLIINFSSGVWYSHVKEEGKKEKDKETEIENNSVNQDIFVIPSVTRKINSLNENRITESFEYSGNYGHNYINGNGCYESMCSTENENDYGDDMMIDENTHTTHEDEKDRKMNIEIERSKINSNKSNTNKNVKNEKSIQPTEEELIKKSKMNKLSDKLMNYSMSLNRSCGVVGGRSVTIPEGKISW